MLLHFTSFGRGVFAIGLNDEAAHFSGVTSPAPSSCCSCSPARSRPSPASTRLLRSGSPAATTRTGLELQVIAAVLLGGVSIFGGRGALHGVIAGVLLIGVLSSALRLQSHGPTTITIIIGLLLVASVVSTSFLPRLRELGASLRPRQKATAAQPTSTADPPARTHERQRNEDHAERDSPQSRRWPWWPRMALAACGNKDDEASGASDGGGQRQQRDHRHLPAQEPRQPLLRHQRRRRQGGRRRVRRHLRRGRPDAAAPDAQVPFINTAAQQGINAMVISANDPTALCDSLNEARDAGTKVVTFDSDTSPDCRDLFINQATAEGIAKVQVDLIAEQIGDAGEIAILSATANATNQNAWIDLMKEQLEGRPPRHQARRRRLRRRRRPDLVRQDRGPAVRPPGPQGHHLARPRSASPPRPATCRPRTPRARSR